MTMARLTVFTGDEPVEVDFNITDPDDKATIEITSTGVEIHTPKEPKVVTT